MFWFHSLRLDVRFGIISTAIDAVSSFLKPLLGFCACVPGVFPWKSSVGKTGQRTLQRGKFIPFFPVGWITCEPNQTRVFWCSLSVILRFAVDIFYCKCVNINGSFFLWSSVTNYKLSSFRTRLNRIELKITHRWCGRGGKLQLLEPVHIHGRAGVGPGGRRRQNQGVRGARGAVGLAARDDALPRGALHGAAAAHLPRLLLAPPRSSSRALQEETHSDWLMAEGGGGGAAGGAQVSCLIHIISTKYNQLLHDQVSIQRTYWAE